MNLEEDESLLSSFLDDELDPADRSAVAWSIETSPALGDQLQAIGLVRDAVAGLGRPASPRDLSAPVVAGLIASSRRRARLRKVARSGQWAATAAGLSAIAACLILAVTLLHRSTHDTGNPTLISSLLGPRTPDRTHPPIPDKIAPAAPPQSVASTGRAITSTSGTPKVVAAQTVTPVRAPKAGPDDGSEARDLVAGMVGRRKVLRALIVTDRIDASERVRALIAGDARKEPDFGRIAVYQGIVVDPDHPDEAEVYPVVLDERGYRPFLEQLGRSFPGLVIEDRVDPDWLTQLPEVGHVAILRGTGAAPLGEPPVELRPIVANKGEPSRDLYVRPGDRHLEAGSPDPLDRADSSTPPGDDPARKPDQSVAILVWVTRPQRR